MVTKGLLELNSRKIICKPTEKGTKISNWGQLPWKYLEFASTRYGLLQNDTKLGGLDIFQLRLPNFANMEKEYLWKNSKNITEEFCNIIYKSNRKPRLIETDDGKIFVNETFTENK